MSRTSDFPENLCARSRRGALSAAEQKELERLLEVSAALRVAHRVGLDFDRIASVEAGDEERVARFVANAVSLRQTRWPLRMRPRRWSAWMLAAAVFGCCAVALGLRTAWGPNRNPALRPPAPAEPSGPSLHPARARGVGAPEPSPLPALSVQLPGQPPTSGFPATELEAPRTSLPALSAPTHRVPPSAEDTITGAQPGRPPPSAAFAVDGAAESTAASLLLQANEMRSRGRTDEAVSLFRQLQQRFPDSPEATLSYVSLGKLLMLRGANESAFQQFSAYLKAGGPLEEEALVGRAQALSAMGRRDEERATWEFLVARFPNSVYAARARDRIQGLTDHPGR